MGIALWAVSGILAFLLARIIPVGRTARRLGELAAAMIAAAVLGIAATAADFGGWNEPDWRACCFVFTGAFAAIGIARLTIGRSPGGSS